jgi:hypothetical protein
MASQTDDDALVAGYIEFAEALGRGVPEESPAMDAAERAYSAVEHAIRRGDGPRAWQLVLDVLRRAPDERLGTYAAGPLEDLVRLRGPNWSGRWRQRRRRTSVVAGRWAASGSTPRTPHPTCSHGSYEQVGT